MTKLIFVRHGQSVANLKQVFAGQTNPDLTEQGHRQAEALSDWIAENYKIDAIYSSDLIRAYNTARPIADKLKLSITKTEKLREIYSGKWQGVSYFEIKENYPQEYSVWLSDIGNVVCPGGESFVELAERVKAEILSIAERHSGQTVIITTHATPIRALMAEYVKGSITLAKDVPWTSNTSVSIAECENGILKFTLVDYTDYLSDLKSKFPSGIV